VLAVGKQGLRHKELSAKDAKKFSTTVRAELVEALCPLGHAPFAKLRTGFDKLRANGT